jgi:hypothetical protein
MLFVKWALPDPRNERFRSLLILRDLQRSEAAPLRESRLYTAVDALAWERRVS